LTELKLCPYVSGVWLNLDEVGTLLETTAPGRRVIYLTSAGSTMEVARREAEEGADEGTVVIAEEQTAGRGRFGRKWVSPAGQNLYFTLVLRPDVARLRSLSIISPLAVCRAVEETTPLRPQIKWPNDVLIENRKLSGILIESEFSGATPRYALVGIGLNVNFRTDDTEVAAIATSIARETGADVSRERVLAAALNDFEALYEAPETAFAPWRERLETLGREVTVTFRDERHSGVAEDVDSEGNLLLRTGDGSLMVFEAGEVSLRA
jgi:BirA family biotin operon repressor/biotin-[acetyl-CoA-carboxylase] ligase